MINRFITWLRRDDQELEWLRREIQQKEKPMDWEKIQLYITTAIIATAIIGLGVMFVMWIAP